MCWSHNTLHGVPSTGLVGKYSNPWTIFLHSATVCEVLILTSSCAICHNRSRWNPESLHRTTVLSLARNSKASIMRCRASPRVVRRVSICPLVRSGFSACRRPRSFLSTLNRQHLPIDAARSGWYAVSGERCGVSPPVPGLESSRHFPSAVALENDRNGGRHTECACYF